MKRKKRRRFDGEREPKDNPLGIGLTKKQLVWIGIGIVGVIALKMYLDKRKRPAAGGAQSLSPGAGPARRIPLDQLLPPDALADGGMAGASQPLQPDMPSEPPTSQSFAQMPQSPPRVVDDSRGGYSRTNGFSGIGDGHLNGANGRL